MDEIFSTYPPEIYPDQLAYLAYTVKNWTVQHGLTVRPSPTFVSDDSNPNHVLATNAPVTLFPSPFPKSCFEHAQSLQTVYNELYAGVSINDEWLGEILRE
jgi:glutathione synthase